MGQGKTIYVKKNLATNPIKKRPHISWTRIINKLTTEWPTETQNAVTTDRINQLLCYHIQDIGMEIRIGGTFALVRDCIKSNHSRLYKHINLYNADKDESYIQFLVAVAEDMSNERD